jgi:hypothetical protein
LADDKHLNEGGERIFGVVMPRKIRPAKWNITIDTPVGQLDVWLLQFI